MWIKSDLATTYELDAHRVGNSKNNTKSTGEVELHVGINTIIFVSRKSTYVGLFEDLLQTSVSAEGHHGHVFQVVEVSLKNKGPRAM